MTYRFKFLRSSSLSWAGRSKIYGGDNTPYMIRYWVGRLRFHIFYRGDTDPDHHDHPWDFVTFPFTTYVEEVITTDNGGNYVVKASLVKAWRFHSRPAWYCHRVLGAYGHTEFADGKEYHFIEPGKKIYTLVWRSKLWRQWGFLKNRDGRWCWVGWKDYIMGGGKDAPCGDGK